MPEVCTATVHALPPTGIAGWVFPAFVAGAIVLLAGGIALLLIASRSGRHAIALVVVLAALVGASTASTTPAHASEAAVSYSEGCTLIVVSDVVVPAASAGRLVPGDELRIVAGSVANPTNSAIRITAEGVTGAELGGAVLLGTRIDGTVGHTAVIPAGGRVFVSLTASIPASAGNAAQGLTSSASLRVTAVQS